MLPCWQHRPGKTLCVAWQSHAALARRIFVWQDQQFCWRPDGQRTWCHDTSSTRGTGEIEESLASLSQISLQWGRSTHKCRMPSRSIKDSKFSQYAQASGLRAEATSGVGLAPCVSHSWTSLRSGSFSWASRNSTRVKPWAQFGIAAWNASGKSVASEAWAWHGLSSVSLSGWGWGFLDWSSLFCCLAKWLRVTTCRHAPAKGITSSMFAAKSCHSTCLRVQYAHPPHGRSPRGTPNLNSSHEPSSGGERERASALVCLRPSWWTMVNLNWNMYSSHLASWPWGSLKRRSQVKELWSVRSRTVGLGGSSWIPVGKQQWPATHVELHSSFSADGSVSLSHRLGLSLHHLGSAGAQLQPLWQRHQCPERNHQSPEGKTKWGQNKGPELGSGRLPEPLLPTWSPGLSW